MACVALPGAGFVPGDVSGGDAVPPCPWDCLPGVLFSGRDGGYLRDSHANIRRK